MMILGSKWRKIGLLVLCLVTAILLLSDKTSKVRLEVKYSPSDSIKVAMITSGAIDSTWSINTVFDVSVPKEWADSFSLKAQMDNIAKIDTLIEDALYFNKEWTKLAYLWSAAGNKAGYYAYIMKADSFMRVANELEDAQDGLKKDLGMIKQGYKQSTYRLIQWSASKDSQVHTVGTTILSNEYRLKPFEYEQR